MRVLENRGRVRTRKFRSSNRNFEIDTSIEEIFKFGRGTNTSKAEKKLKEFLEGDEREMNAKTILKRERERERE